MSSRGKEDEEEEAERGSARRRSGERRREQPRRPGLARFDSLRLRSRDRVSSPRGARHSVLPGLTTPALAYLSVSYPLTSSRFGPRRGDLGENISHFCILCDRSRRPMASIDCIAYNAITALNLSCYGPTDNLIRTFGGHSSRYCSPPGDHRWVLCRLLSCDWRSLGAQEGYVPLTLQPLNAFELVERFSRSHGLVYVPCKRVSNSQTRPLDGTMVLYVGADLSKRRSGGPITVALSRSLVSPMSYFDVYLLVSCEEEKATQTHKQLCAN